MRLIDRAVGVLTNNSRKVIAVMLLLTLVIGPGVGMVEQSSSFDQFQGSTTESQKLDYIDTNFETGNQNTTSVQIILRGDNVLSKDSLVSTLQAEQSLLEDDDISETLVEENPVYGPANAIAIAGIQQDPQANASNTSLNAQISQLNSMNASELDAAIGTALGGDSQSSSEVLALMPKDYEPGDTSADAMMVMVTQNSGGGGGLSSGAITETQLSMQTIFEQATDDNQIRSSVADCW